LSFLLLVSLTARQEARTDVRNRQSSGEGRSLVPVSLLGRAERDRNRQEMVTERGRHRQGDRDREKEMERDRDRRRDSCL
jgi:hypothetical protein